MHNIKEKSKMNVLSMKINIPYKWLVLLSYLYMIIPISIFFVGYLKIGIGILFTVVIFGGLYFAMKEYDSMGKLEINIVHLAVLILLLLGWIYMSGIGGWTYQRWDWHGRNAVLHDLIDYTWPVVYPETGNALVYYFIYWMVPAVAGKLAGWACANFILFLWSFLGIFLAVLNICYLLRAKSGKDIFKIALIFIFWGGLNLVGYAYTFYVVNGYHGIMPFTAGFEWPINGYQYTPNNALIEWVFNQSIVPLMAMPLYLSNRKIEILAFLGLCVLPFAPLPFVGLFLIFVAIACVDSVQFIKEKKFAELIKKVFSIANIAAVLSIFICFLAFFSCNTATNGSAGVGGIGLYTPLEQFGLEDLQLLIIFCILEFGVYSILLFDENKKEPLYWVSSISLVFIPLIRIGAGKDFCMRASIPALTILMILVMKYILKAYKKSVRYIVMVVFLVIAGLSSVADWAGAIKAVWQNDGKPVLADDLKTFTDKMPTDTSSDTDLINFVATNPYDTVFFKYLAKGKTEEQVLADKEATATYLKENGLVLCSGVYSVSPVGETVSLDTDGRELYLTEEGTCNIATAHSDYRFYFSDYAVGLGLPSDSECEDAQASVSKRNNTEAQLWNIEQENDYYYIKHGDYYLTYVDGDCRLGLYNGTQNQRWKITRR
jgi:hypothetical protein